MHHQTGIKWKWLAKMAWRDSRKNRPRLFLFISSIILGIAALVAIYSLSDNLNHEIDQQAASLIGADLEISNSKPYTPQLLQLIQTLGDRRSEENGFLPWFIFPKAGGTRIIEVRALGGDFPYYGELETEPAAAGQQFRKKSQALVDQTLMLQFDAHVGDSVRIGNTGFVIGGTLVSAPGQTGISVGRCADSIYTH